MDRKIRLAGSLAAAAALIEGALYLAQARIVRPAGTPTGLMAASLAQEGGYLPDPNRKYPERVLWGDEHVHTGKQGAHAIVTERAQHSIAIRR